MVVRQPPPACREGSLTDTSGSTPDHSTKVADGHDLNPTVTT